MLSCSYIKPQHKALGFEKNEVVCYHVPTSNHNLVINDDRFITLYVIMFLHQTTTHQSSLLHIRRCMLSCSYIKPQQSPVSTHWAGCCMLSCSYIKPQLHLNSTVDGSCCMLSCSYIKPQPSRPLR